MNPCKIVQDLLPLYVEDICSQSSREYVKGHLAECAECRTVHKAMNKRVQIVSTQQSAKKSFAAFKRKMLLRRTLLIALCVLIVLAPIAYFAYDKYTAYQHLPRPARIEPIVSTVSLLTDGSIYLTLQYTDDDVYINSFSMSRAHMNNPFSDTDIWFEDENTLYIQPGYSLFMQSDKRMTANNRIPQKFIISTDESYPKYQHYSEQYEGFNHSYTRIVLLGSDGERVLWQKGDELPAADITAEAALIERIDSLEYINSLPTPDPKT